MDQEEQRQASSPGWIGIDLDGTLAEYHGWEDGMIGPPIPIMLEFVKGLLAKGKTVKIMTARVALSQRRLNEADVEAERQKIEAWCQRHLGQVLEVTAQKDYRMTVLYDDRAIGIIHNTGLRCCQTI